MNVRFRRHILMDAAVDAGTGGGAPAAADPAAPSGGAPATPGAGGAAPAGGAEPSLLQQGAAGSPGSPAAAGGGEWLQEQFKVMGPDGKVDEAASARKQAEAYAPLLQRMRDGGAPPKTADEYQLEVPETLKGVYDPAKDTMLNDFRARALEAGLTQKQFQAMAGGYIERIPQIVEGLFEAKRADGEVALRQEWKSDEQFTAGLRNAATAVRGFDPKAIGEDGTIDNPQLQSLMNNPFFLRFAAHFGAQMQEDTSPGTQSTLPAGSPYRGMTREQLEQNEAYLNARHPDHKLVSRMVQEAYHRETGESLPG